MRGHRSRAVLVGLVELAVVVAGCSRRAASRGTPDAGAVDAGAVDAGAVDAGRDAPGADAMATDVVGATSDEVSDGGCALGPEVAPVIEPFEPPEPRADPALAGATHHHFKISVLDAATRAPVPGARLTTTNKIALQTDINGVAAFYEPGLMGIDVYFSVARAGYEVPADAFGYHGKALRTDEGGAGEILLTKTVATPPPVSGLDDLQTRLLAKPVPAAADCFGIRVVDPAGLGAGPRGVPLVFLTAPDGVYVTDSQGTVAYCNPDRLDAVISFGVSSPGYRFAAGSVLLYAKRGAASVVQLARVNLAERLYRVTGQGIYRDSVLLGLTAPTAHPVMNGLVMGQDTVDATPYEGKLFWIWGDTDRAAYPLGNFRTSGAGSALPGAGLPGAFGVDTTYIVGADGFSRGIIEDIAPSSNPTWIGALLALPDAGGAERLFAVYSKPDANLATLSTGLVRFDDAQELFVRAGVEFPLTDFVAPAGQPTIVRGAAGAYVYYGPPLRVPATAEALVAPAGYEVWSALGAHGGKTLERAADGTAAYGWKTGALETTPTVIEAAGLPANQALGGHVTDADTGETIATAGNGGESWNEHRKRFVKIIQQLGGSTSTLGELWVLEADTPVGPWVYARKVVTHDDYTFYNPWLHPYLQEQGGRIVYFEATYTKSFAGTKTPVTPRYDYNQMMYRLDLDDARLALPAPVYDVGAAPGLELASKAGLRGGPALAAPAFYAPDRAAPGTVPVSWSGAACAPRTLVVGGVPATPPLFYALPAAFPTGTATRPPNVVPLYELRNAAGARRYAVSASAGGVGLPAVPIAFVWPSPISVALPVRDFLGDVVADAGADQCLTESAAGAGADVTLDGAASDLAGGNPSFTWRAFGDACPIASTKQAKVHLAAGVHAFVLTVEDAAGPIATDSVIIQVAAP